MKDVVKGTLQPETVVYEWKIERFFADCESVGDSYTSPFFFANHPDKNITQWYIRIYPKGLKEDEKDYIPMWLNFAVADSRELTVSFTFSIVNNQNNSFRTRKVTSKFKGPSVGCGIRLEQSIIKDIGDLTDDTLTIMCEIRYNQADQVVAEKLYGQHLTKIGNGFDDYEELFESASFSDVTFNIQEQKIHLHKAILSHRSPVFKAMFELEMKEKKQSSVDITNFDHPVMKELFRFIYAERVEGIENIAKDLLVAADYYSIVELKGWCENVLYDKLEVQNAVEYLNLTDMCHTVYLKSIVTDFTAKHYKEIIKEPGFVDLNSKIMYQIMQAMAKNDN